MERDQEEGIADLKIELWFVNPMALCLEITAALPQEAMAMADDLET